MEAQKEHESPHRPRSLLRRALTAMKLHTDDPSGSEADAQHGAQRRSERLDPLPAQQPTQQPIGQPIEQPAVHGADTWSQVGAVPVPKSRSHPDPVELPDSRAEPGGPPVYADPNMVTPAAAEQMRPLFRQDR